MSTRKSSAFYGVLIALASLVVGMVIASHLGMTPASVARPLDMPETNSSLFTGLWTSTRSAMSRARQSRAS